jgi:hypothetical protein
VPAGPADPSPPPEPDGLRDVNGRERRLVTRTRERHAAVYQLLAAGYSLGSVSRTLGLDRKTVQQFTRQPDVDKLLVKATSRETKLDPFKAWICQRWNEGITDACVPHACGWTGGVQAVRRHVRPFRALAAASPPPSAVRKALQITGWLLRRPETLSDDEQAQLAAIRAHCPYIDALADHVTSFAEMMTRRAYEREETPWHYITASHHALLGARKIEVRASHCLSVSISRIQAARDLQGGYVALLLAQSQRR